MLTRTTRSSLTKVSSKIMILHAEDDFVIPIYQADKVSSSILFLLLLLRRERHFASVRAFLLIFAFCFQLIAKERKNRTTKPSIDLISHTRTYHKFPYISSLFVVVVVVVVRVHENTAVKSSTLSSRIRHYHESLNLAAAISIDMPSRRACNN